MKGTQGFSEALVGAYGNDFPGKNPPSDRTLKRYWKQIFSPSEIQSVYSSLTNSIRTNGKLKIWRSVKVSGDPVEEIAKYASAKGLGLYWSWDRDAAHPHDAHHIEAPTYLMEAAVGYDDIDWIDTLAACVVPDWAGEREVRILPTTRLRLASLLERRGWLHRLEDDQEREIDLASLADLEFFAGQAIERNCTPDIQSSPALR